MVSSRKPVRVISQVQIRKSDDSVRVRCSSIAGIVCRRTPIGIHFDVCGSVLQPQRGARKNLPLVILHRDNQRALLRNDPHDYHLVVLSHLSIDGLPIRNLEAPEISAIWFVCGRMRCEHDHHGFPGGQGWFRPGVHFHPVIQRVRDGDPKRAGAAQAIVANLDRNFQCSPRMNLQHRAARNDPHGRRWCVHNGL